MINLQINHTKQQAIHVKDDMSNFDVLLHCLIDGLVFLHLLMVLQFRFRQIILRSITYRTWNWKGSWRRHVIGVQHWGKSTFHKMNWFRSRGTRRSVVASRLELIQSYISGWQCNFFMWSKWSIEQNCWHNLIRKLKWEPSDTWW